MTLENYYRINFSLQQYHKWPIDMIEKWLPNEREIYVMLLSQYIDEEQQKNQNNI